MPLYEFRCRSCQLQFTKLARLSEAGSPLGCPACGAPVTKLVSSCALHRSEAARLADFDPRDARRPDFYRDAYNVGLAAQRRLRDSAVDLGPRVEEIIERGRTGQILDEAL